MACIDHHRTVKARIDTLVASLFIAMIQVDGEYRLRINLARRPDHCFEHPLVSIFPSPLRNLNDKWRLGIYASFKQAKDLLEIVDIVSTYCVL
jgi:ABC-type sugar transport system ATPase subunit